MPDLVSEVDSDRRAARGSWAWPLPGSGARARFWVRRARAAICPPHHVAWPLEQFLQPGRQASGHACIAAYMEFPYSCMDAWMR